MIPCALRRAGKLARPSNNVTMPIRDDWHAIRPAKYGNVPHVGMVEFPLQRTLSGVPY